MYKYTEINLNNILNKLRKGAVVSIRSEFQDKNIDDPVYIAAEVKSEKSVVELNSLAHLNQKKELDDLKNIIRGIVISKRIAKVYYTRVSLFSDPLITVEYDE